VYGERAALYVTIRCAERSAFATRACERSRQRAMMICLPSRYAFAAICRHAATPYAVTLPRELWLMLCLPPADAATLPMMPPPAPRAATLPPPPPYIDTIYFSCRFTPP